MDDVLLLTSDNDKYSELLSQTGCRLSDNPNQATIWLAEPKKAAALLKKGHRPSWIASTFAGVDPLMADDLPQDYTLTNIHGIFGPLMAEYVFAHLLSRLRQVSLYAEQQQNRTWQPHDYSSLVNKTLVLLGTGSIGQHIATVAKGFGMKTVGVSLSGTPRPGFDQVYKVTELEQVLPLADVLVSSLPNTPESQNLLDSQRLDWLPSHATIINVGRGQTLCINGLLKRLNKAPLSHAVLDVFEYEPLPSDSPLWHHPQITITPHIAATSFPEQIMAQFISNLARYREGQPLQYQVDFSRGY